MSIVSLSKPSRVSLRKRHALPVRVAPALRQDLLRNDPDALSCVLLAGHVAGLRAYLSERGLR